MVTRPWLAEISPATLATLAKEGTVGEVASVAVIVFLAFIAHRLGRIQEYVRVIAANLEPDDDDEPDIP